MELNTVHERHIILIISGFSRIYFRTQFIQPLALLNHTITLQDHKHFAFENQHRLLNILCFSIRKNVIDRNHTVSGYSSPGARGSQQWADSRAGAMTTRSAGLLVRGEPKEKAKI